MTQLPVEFFDSPEGKEIVSKYKITEVELDTLRRTLDGQTANKIAEELSLSDQAIRKRLGALYNRFGITGSVLGKLERLEKVLLDESEVLRHENIDKTLIGLTDRQKTVGFYGRNNELEILKNYVLDKNRLILVSGAGGIGKSSLVEKFVKDNNILEFSFQKVQWYSLRTTPSVIEQVKNIIEDISGERENFSSDLDIEIKKLIKLFRDRRCLIVFDNVESILLKGGSGKYKDSEYDGYGDLFRTIAEERHNSCLILTSREQPEGIDYLKTKNLPVRILKLEGLKEDDADRLFKDLLSQDKEDKNR
jgi:DNA-binding CsgD family transcriptional regulator